MINGPYIKVLENFYFWENHSFFYTEDCFLFACKNPSVQELSARMSVSMCLCVCKAIWKASAKDSE